MSGQNMRFDFKSRRNLILLSLGVVVLLALSIFVVLRQHQKAEQEALQRQEDEVRRTSLSEEDVKASQLTVKKAEGGTLSEYIFLFGKVDLHPERAMHLHPKFSGVVRGVFKATGDRVKPGEVLARIENNVGVQTFDLTSAINGIVIDRRIAVGQAISEDVEAFTIADPSLVMVKLTAYAKDLVKLSKGQQVIVSVNEVPDLKEVVTYVSPVLDEDTQSAPVLVTIDNSDLKLKPGQFATGRVITGEASVGVRLPKEFIEMRGGDRGVIFARKNGNFFSRAVRIGRSDKNYLEIVEGLAPGEEYIEKPYSELSVILDRKLVRKHGI